MDRLNEAYGSQSDEEDDDPTAAPATKRTRFEVHPSSVIPQPVRNFRDFSGSWAPNEVATMKGRYVSKRERAHLGSEARKTSVNSLASISGARDITDSDVPRSSFLKSANQVKGNLTYSKNLKKSAVQLKGHKKAVNAVQWSPNHSHLLASAGMDKTVRVWNVWHEDNPTACIFSHHTAAVKDLRWSRKGLTLLSCGFDRCSRMVDVEKGMEEMVLQEDQELSTIKFHPENDNLFLSGGSKGSLRLWDIRKKSFAQEYVKKPMGPILGVDFSPNGRHFVASSDVSQSNASENAIVVWDLARQIPLSNQLYVEAYTCPWVGYHPREDVIVAQSNGNYAAIFSSRPPFKLDRYRRFEGHAVAGFPVRFDFSAAGDILASASADGSAFFFSYRSAHLLLKMDIFQHACVDVAFHPSSPSVDGFWVAACSWDGDVAVFRAPQLRITR
ncbi:transducin/WD40 repeat-like superfamily protein [Wolffia australiana]